MDKDLVAKFAQMGIRIESVIPEGATPDDSDCECDMCLQHHLAARFFKRTRQALQQISNFLDPRSGNRSRDWELLRSNIDTLLSEIDAAEAEQETQSERVAMIAERKVIVRALLKEIRQAELQQERR